MEKWEKEIHIKSSMEAKEGQFAMFIGRWQPLHLAHKEMFQQAISEGKNVLICIRDVECDTNQPFTPEQVKANIEKEYSVLVKSKLVKVMIVPDICSVEFGRGVGYDVIEHIPPTQIGDVSATKIREQMRKEGKL
jgi:nicotinamide mononucleotide adenylyltransferase